jgi:light-regulated signal transduction histidine kinase (bacteriophytochrome)
MQQQNELETRTKQLEDLLENKTGQLAHVTRELDDLIFAISHDLKAPVRAIAGFSAILSEEYSESLDEEAKRLLAVVQKNAGTLTNMLNEIVTYSAISKKNIVHRPVNMHQLVNASFETLLSSKESNMFDINIDPLLSCSADESMMKQLWLNFLNMVLLHAEKNTCFKLQINSFEQDGQIVYCAKARKAEKTEHADAQEHLNKTITNRENLEGNGTGAAFIKRVLFKHGGNFWIQAIPGCEYIFSFSIPVKADTSTSTPDQKF